MQATWGTCKGSNVWCGFFSVDLNHQVFDNEGLYIVWQKGGAVIRVGRGRLRDKITEDRKNPTIAANTNLLVTWAVVSAKDRSAMEKYLVERLSPLISNQPLTENPSVPINLPWPYKN